MNTHTPGCKKGWRITGCEGCEMAIELAPEMLEALKAVRLADVHTIAREMIVKAIAKAEGRV